MIVNIVILCTPVGKATTVVQSTLRVKTTTLSTSQYINASSFLVQRNQSYGYITTVGSTCSVLNFNSTTSLKREKLQRKRMNYDYDVSIEMRLIIILPKKYKLHKFIKLFVWIAVRQL